MGADERQPFTNAVVRSEAKHRLIVAGPGTGKTHVFGKALTEVNGEGLALTFIRNLASDLNQSLAGRATASTLHSFSRFHLSRADSCGLTSGFEYYPQLLKLLAEDLEAFGPGVRSVSDVESWLHELDEVAPLDDVLKLGSYYNAVSHLDSVYRTVLHFRGSPEDIPEYPLLLIDEVQDFSPLEIALVELLAKRSPTLIVGDDDQALYSFKSASAEAFLKLVSNSRYERFNLPYCSRCTHIVIKAFKDVVRSAQANGLLLRRLDKPFKFHASSKREDSSAYPRLLHAKCSVDTKKAPYMGRYVAECIAQIPHSEIEESVQDRYPTALVIGPKPYLGKVFAEVKKGFEGAEIRESERLRVSPLDGYRLIADDSKSKLGWRILLHCSPLPSLRDEVCHAISRGLNLVNVLPEDYREHHLGVAQAVGLRCKKQAPTEEDVQLLMEHTGLPFAGVSAWVEDRKRLHGEGTHNAGVKAASQEAPRSPSIVFTSLRGAKGLSGGHVFIVGINNGHLPKNPDAISDDEVRSLLVALTRTRKQCHLVSCGMMGGKWKRPSVFLDWIRSACDEVVVDADYWRGRAI